MVFDGVFAFAGDDDDVFDAGGYALFNDVLNLRLVHDGKHFFRLSFGGRKKTSAESRGREHGLANFVLGDRGAVGGSSVGHGLRFLHSFKG